MDINDRDSNLEKNEKTMKSLREGWKNVRAGKTLLTEGKDAKAVAKELRSKQGIKTMKEQDTEETKAAEVSEVPPVDSAVPPTDAPVDPAAPVVPPVVPAAPTDALAPVGLQPNPEKQLATQQFVQATLKGVQSGDQDNKSLVTEYGFFKADVTDPANGQFTVVAFPAGMKLKDIAAIVEPVDAAVPAATETPVDAAVPAPEVSPENSPEDKAEDAIEGGEESEPEEKEDAEALAESVRDPIVIGKKNWKSYLQNLLTESKKNVSTKLTEAEEKKEEVKELSEETDKHLEQLEKELKDAEAKKDEKEVEELKKEIAAHKEKKISEKGKKNASEVAKKSAEKDKDDVQKLMKKDKGEEKEEEKK